ncbi:glycosyltransferase [Candidatus Nitrososphaera evergladensis]|uniref:glycosyltransferase n=1 Tax=Candidatus Nitrososphaera evergladensis TaxID=1459637 RepID=UPI00130E983B|nr:glycosyltransferase [Candidatus Nitrososphaera evergladensis]
MALSAINTLNEMGFQVDLASFTQPNVKEIKRDFGISDLAIRNVEKIDIFSLLQADKDDKSHDQAGSHSEAAAKVYGDDDRYDLVINTHGDLLPYYYHDDDEHDDNIKRTGLRKNFVTYCHFPLLPQLVDDGSYMKFINKWTSMDLAADKDPGRKILTSSRKMYDTMMQHANVVLTNSQFSRNAIEQHYNKVNPVVVYPPVDVKKFHDVFTYSGKKEENSILVLSRFSPDKQIENAVKVAGILKDKETSAKMTLAGNISEDDQQYLEKLKQMIDDSNLQDNVHIEVDVSFPRLLELMKQSKVFLHPLAGEPFGIAIVEAMSAGLIPVVPHVGGNTEFVPSEYQFHSLEEAADIIAKRALAASDSLQDRSKMGEIASRFSVGNFNKNLKSVISPLLVSAAGEEEKYAESV